MGLLQTKIMMKKRKPTFLRSGYGRVKGLDRKWIKPKGIHNKMRLKKGSRRKLPNIGYGSPKELKNVNSQGLREIKINNISELMKMNPKENIVILSSKVGIKTRLAMLKKAKELKLNIRRVSDIEQEIKKIESTLETKKQEKKKKIEQKKKNKEKAAKQTKEKKQKEDSKKENEQESKKEETKKSIEGIDAKEKDVQKEIKPKQPQKDMKGMQKRIGRTQ